MSGVLLEEVHKLFRRGGIFSRRQVEVHALKGISLHVGPGEVLALLGPNGSGKSTALKLISTILLPDQGRVVVNGHDSVRDGHSVRRQVGFALTSERSFFPRLTARENLEFFAALEEVPRRERRMRVSYALESAALDALADRQVMKLSSGNFQRLAIARALIKFPSVLLLDEPTRSLDPDASSQFWGLVRELAAKGTAVVIATHNFMEAVSVAHRIAVLDQGQLLGVRETRAQTAERLRDFYMEVVPEREGRTYEEIPA